MQSGLLCSAEGQKGLALPDCIRITPLDYYLEAHSLAPLFHSEKMKTEESLLQEVTTWGARH